MKLIKNAAFAVVLTSAAVNLSGCKKMSSAPGNVAGSVGGGSTDLGAADTAAAKKLDAYIEAHNKLVGTFGFQERANAYRKADIANASLGGYFDVRAGWIGQGVTQLKSAREMSGGAGDLNAAADALIASMGTVGTHLADLETYYSSKKYLDDKLARGKAEDAAVLAELDTATKQLGAFNVLLDREIEARDQVMLDKLKASGNTRRYNTKLALIHAKKLADLLDTPADRNNPAMLVRADAEVAIIEQAIAGAHAASTSAGKSDPTGLGLLTSMLGSYRAFKQSHEPSELATMIRYYNGAVDSTNTFSATD